MTSTGAPPVPDARVFNQERDTDLRRARPWHRFAYIVRRLPQTIEAVAAGVRLSPGDRVLDYGCAELPYRQLFGPETEHVGADLPGNPDARVEINPDGSLPEPAGSYAAVLSTQVLEHVGDPALYVSECFRVLRPGGHLLLSTHGTMFYHPDPVDYWRWTSAGLRHELERAGFEVERFEGVVGLTAMGVHFVHDGLYYRAPRWLKPVVALLLQPLVAAADRYDGPVRRRRNAMVYIVLARKP